jgi:hypothetical protein
MPCVIAAPQDRERARNNLEFGLLSSLEDLFTVASTLNEIQPVYVGVEHFNDWPPAITFRVDRKGATQTPVKVDKTREAMAEFTKQLRGLAGEWPITREELAAAKQARTWAFGLPLSDLETWPQLISSVTLEEANAAARKYARPDQAVFLLVGRSRKGRA